MNEPVDDPLKPLDQVLEPDIRSTTMGMYDPGTGIRKETLEDHHAEIARVTLNESAPLAVRQLFENAKNLVLYSWFFYRFHQSAELSGFGALEMALREKAKKSAAEWWSNNSKKHMPSMKKLFEKAKNDGWIRNEEFSAWRQRQQQAAYDRRVEELSQKMIEEGVSEIELPHREEFEGIIGDETFDYLEILLKTIPPIRNNLAHGAQTLHPDSLDRLKLCAEIINQLFPD
ncbi:MAG: hypothetical protein WCC11_06070 [Gammaproteobacteria bacterium]